MKPAKDFIYVSLQLGIFMLFAFPPQVIEVFTNSALVPISKFIGGFLIISGISLGILAALQLNTNLTPFPTPKATGQLIQNGVYAIVRHPIYLSILLLFLGFSLFLNDPNRLLITVILGILFHFKSDYEEQLLRQKYPKYEEYILQTGRLFPRIFRR